MKILHINTNDISGGAARAAYRLHTALNKAGHDSYMLVADRQSDEHKIIGLRKSKYQKLMDKIYNMIYPRYFSYHYKPISIFSTNRLIPSSLVSNIREIKPDVIHLHWITDQFINLHDLLKLGIPLMWTLHDEWAITGGCHINHNCYKFTAHCASCPVLQSDNQHDISYKQFELKLRLYKKLPKLVFNGVSKWTAKLAQQSQLSCNHRSINLPNTIDIQAYSPVDKQRARQILNLPIDKKIILFGAMSATSDKNKGFDLLVSALNQINNSQKNIELLIFGSSHYDGSLHKFTVKCLGHLHDDYSLKLLYSAADVMIVPSRQENLSNAIMESLACGTPVVAFDIGGNSDMIEHEQNGYLAKPFDCADLANGINWVLYNQNYQQLSINARAKVVDNFSEEIIIPKYIQAYKELLQR